MTVPGQARQIRLGIRETTRGWYGVCDFNDGLEPLIIGPFESRDEAYAEVERGAKALAKRFGWEVRAVQ